MSHNFIWKREKIVGFDIEIPVFEDSNKVANSVILAGGPHLDIKYLEGLCCYINTLGYQPIIVGFPGHMGTHVVKIESYEELSSLISKFLDSKFDKFPRLIVGHSLGGWLANSFIARQVHGALDCKLVHFCLPFEYTNEKIDEAVRLVSAEVDDLLKLQKLLEFYFLNNLRRVEVDVLSLDSSFSYFITSNKIIFDLDLALKRVSDCHLVFGTQDIMSAPDARYEKYSSLLSTGHFPMIEAEKETHELLKKFL
jgi:pimeloyl-ACP methyl ester carboxylesterase